MLSRVKAFAKNEEGSIAIYFTIIALPLMGLIGASVDYTRVTMHDSKLQSTLEQSIVGITRDSFKSSDEMKNYIVSLAAANTRSTTIEGAITVNDNVLRVELRDVVKTPVLNVIGRSEFEVEAHVNLTIAPVETTPTIVVKDKKTAGSSSTKRSEQTKNRTKQISRSDISRMRSALRKAKSRVSNMSLPPATKRRILNNLQKQIQYLNQQSKQAR